MGATPLRLATAVGLIDGSYRDEVFVCVDNNSTKPFMIKRGTAYFQAVACDGGEIRQEVVDPSTQPGFQTGEGNEPFYAAPAPHWREVPGNALRSREFRRAPHLRKTRVGTTTERSKVQFTRLASITPSQTAYILRRWWTMWMMAAVNRVP